MTEILGKYQGMLEAVIEEPRMNFELKHSLKNFWVYGWMLDKCEMGVN